MIYLPTYEKEVELTTSEKNRRDAVLEAVIKKVCVIDQDREYEVIKEAITYSIWVGYEAPNFVAEEITQNLIALVSANPHEDFLLRRIVEAPTIGRMIRWAVEDSFLNARDYHAQFAGQKAHPDTNYTSTL